MESTDFTDALTALGHPGRMAVFRLLMRRAPQGVRPSEIAGALGLQPNTLSAYLATLGHAGLVRSERQGRAVLYRLERARIAALTAWLVDDCCRGRPELCLPIQSAKRGNAPMTQRTYNVLFVCTGNSARSLIAEAIVNADDSGRFRAHSAGTHAASEPNPFALELLQHHGHDTSVLRSKKCDEFTGPDAPVFDFVFTVCDRAANEECPAWPGQPVTAHWGMPDPVKAQGTEAERALAFRQAYRTLHHRLRAFLALPIASLDRLSLQNRLDAIGEMNAETVASA
jgi:ArsR family transcriptional regulator, arsenate/arsenite/antimonite-responsive transcriptional repressor / arsenate reductase (thioredoxin)